VFSSVVGVTSQVSGGVTGTRRDASRSCCGQLTVPAQHCTCVHDHTHPSRSTLKNNDTKLLAKSLLVVNQLNLKVYCSQKTGQNILVVQSGRKNRIKEAMERVWRTRE
jgi:hypothetical protein